jgi:hypothetical protein
MFLWNVGVCLLVHTAFHAEGQHRHLHRRGNLVCLINQSYLKVTQHIPDTCSIWQKINFTGNRKQTQCYINRWKCPPRSVMRAFSSCLMQPREELVPLSSETVPETGYRCLVWHRRIGKYILKLILKTKVKTRRQAEFDSEHSLHMWKIRPWISTVWRQLTGVLARAGYNSDILCLLIQSKFTEFQPSINISIWIAWFM